MTQRSLQLGVLLFGALVAGGCGSNKTNEGTMQIGTFSVQVNEEGSFNPGSTSHYAIKVNGGQEVDSVQAWFGFAGDTTRVVGVFDPNDGDYDVDVEIPSPVPFGAQLFVTVTNGSESATGSFTVIN
jgi:hypothetical protein